MGPIRGQTRPVPIGAEIKPSKTNVQLNASIHNRFDIEVIDAATGEVRQRAQAENVICNNLWGYLGYNAWNQYIQYGSGSGTPAATDTALFSFVGSDTPTTVSKVYDAATGVFSLQRKIKLLETTAVGKTITEVGIGYGNNYALCTHAMLTDMNGNQISIAKTATDIINIYTTVFCHANGGYKKYFALGESSPVFLAAVGIGTSPNPFNSATLLSGNGSTGTAFSCSTDTSTKRITATMYRLAAANGNLGGLTAIVSDTGAIYADDAWSNGSSITGEAVGTGDGTKKDFSTAFGLVKPGAKIYVNGVEDTTATVDSRVPVALNYPENYLKMIDVNGNAACGRFATIVGNADIILYNPYYDTMGITAVAASYAWAYCYVSNDMKTWTQVADFTTSGKSIAATYTHFKYFKFVRDTGTDPISIHITSTDCSGKNIHFATAPASGAIITADYGTELIAKDANHVFDMTFTIQFGEHTT